MDKQDELAAALRKAGQESSGYCPASQIDWDAIAAAVRSFMGSDEPVAWMYERGGPFPVRYIHDQRTPAYLEPVDHGFGLTSGEWTETPLYARAALSAAIGEDIGGGQ